jgi:hypothetical protein
LIWIKVAGGQPLNRAILRDPPGREHGRAGEIGSLAHYLDYLAVGGVSAPHRPLVGGIGSTTDFDQRVTAGLHYREFCANAPTLEALAAEAAGEVKRQVPDDTEADSER